MRIGTNMMAVNTYNQLTKSSGRITKSVAKLSSGEAILSAADDAAGLAISEKMRAQIRGLTVAMKNTQDAVSLVQTAESALSGMSSILQRMNSLAVQATSGTLENEDREALQKEFGQLKDEINEIAARTTFNKQHLLDGSLSGDEVADADGSLFDTDLTIQVGPNAGDTLTINIGKMDAFSIGIGSVGIGTREAAESTISAIGNAIDAVSSQRAYLGAIHSRLGYKYDNLSTTCENLTAAESRIRDVDMAKEITEFMTASVLQQVGTAMLAQANSEPKDVLYLMQSM